MVLDSVYFIFHIICLILWVGSLTPTYAFGQPTSNIALHQPAFQQNTYTLDPIEPNEDRFDASNAVDGLKSDLSGLGGQCSLTANNKTTATWWVNLTRVANIHYIIIYYRTDNVVWDSSNGYTSRFLGFSIYVSNTTSKIDGVLCYKDNIFTTETIPAVFNITCAVYGQYVIYYNERLPGLVYPHGYSKYAFADICELEVYECDIGYYGYNCTETCGHCVDETECSPVDGTCPTGCSARYFGQLCKTECKSGNYGLRCNETCGHCSDLMYCSHVNGTCLTGCMPGYEGKRCQQICKFGFYGIGCLQECSSFCKTSRDCDHVSGVCRHGCRNGWEGDDCFDVSNINEDGEESESKFHGFVAAFCVSLGLNCILIAIFVVKRLRRASPGVAKDQVKKEKYKGDNDVSKEASNETSYQELGEINKSETYESCQ